MSGLDPVHLPDVLFGVGVGVGAGGVRLAPPAPEPRLAVTEGLAYPGAIAVISADVLPAVETQESPDWLTSSLPLAGAEYLGLRDITEVSSPARATVTVVGLVTVAIDTAGVGNTGVAGLALVAQLTETLARLEIRLIRGGGGRTAG